MPVLTYACAHTKNGMWPNAKAYMYITEQDMYLALNFENRHDRRVNIDMPWPSHRHLCKCASDLMLEYKLSVFALSVFKVFLIQACIINKNKIDNL